MEIKLRYVAKDDEGNISTKVFTIGQIEMGNPVYWLTSLLGKNVKLISRDMFTGKQDKNGKDIYEGDIFKLHEKHINDNIYMFVVWDNDMSTFAFDSLKNKNNCGIFAEWHIKNMEVVGNIHQNTELLND